MSPAAHTSDLRQLIFAGQQPLKDEPGPGVVATVDAYQAVLGRRTLLAELRIIGTGTQSSEGASIV